MPATLADADELLRRGLRRSDMRETRKCTDLTPEQSLRLGVRRSEQAFAVRLNDRLLALTGVCGVTLSGDLGVGRQSFSKTHPHPVFRPGVHLGLVWLKAHTDVDLPRYLAPLARLSRRWTAIWQKQYPLLGNVVDPEHRAALRWLEWLGFKIDREHPVTGPLGHELYLFWRKNNV